MMKFTLTFILTLSVMSVGRGQAGSQAVAYTETRSLGIALQSQDALAKMSDLPRQISASEYSLNYARQTLVPAMGGSIAVGDFDQDGNADIYASVPGGSNHLFRNNGNTFTDVTEKAGVAGTGVSLSAAFSDYDHSGHPSLFVAGLGGVVLYHNNGDGTFSDETDKAGLRAGVGELYTHAALADIDDDGFQDILLTAYTDLNTPPSKPVFAFPNDFAGMASRLYRNNTDGTFSDITASTDLVWNRGRARNAIFADFNNDGHADLILLRDEKAPAIYLNHGAGRFQEWTWNAGDQLSRNAFVDAQAADFNHDGRVDLALWSTMANRVMLNRGSARFELAESLPLVAPPPSPFGFHGTVADLNGDGFDDLLSLDSDGHWRLLLNRGKSFEEAPFTILSKSARPFSANFVFLTAIRLKDDLCPYLLTLQRDGQIGVFVRR